MAELVDAADLKSADYYNLKGSSPFIPIENFFKKKNYDHPPPSLLQMNIDQSVDIIKPKGASTFKKNSKKERETLYKLNLTFQC